MTDSIAVVAAEINTAYENANHLNVSVPREKLWEWKARLAALTGAPRKDIYDEFADILRVAEARKLVEKYRAAHPDIATSAAGLTDKLMQLANGVVYDEQCRAQVSLLDPNVLRPTCTPGPDGDLYSTRAGRVWKAYVAHLQHQHKANRGAEMRRQQQVHCMQLAMRDAGVPLAGAAPKRRNEYGVTTYHMPDVGWVLRVEDSQQYAEGQTDGPLYARLEKYRDALHRAWKAVRKGGVKPKRDDNLWECIERLPVLQMSKKDATALRKAVEALEQRTWGRPDYLIALRQFVDALDAGEKA